ncbi:hypothetical protein EG68_07962 [Paragonimus skrjabini miyazakii]|uniref:C2H2-type domain-containing protein n=1 Tax=Paragonimus skrjabini miyazakii TaxID=59628 RepID=A0A8S9Y8C0_9TREM|nr:hypothetical protein EG68_07962 [Paragonimus skrjabini miyazakii]
MSVESDQVKTIRPVVNSVPRNDLAPLVLKLQLPAHPTICPTQLPSPLTLCTLISAPKPPSSLPPALISKEAIRWPGKQQQQHPPAPTHFLNAQSSVHSDPKALRILSSTSLNQQTRFGSSTTSNPLQPLHIDLTSSDLPVVTGCPTSISTPVMHSSVQATLFAPFPVPPALFTHSTASPTVLHVPVLHNFRQPLPASAGVGEKFMHQSALIDRPRFQWCPSQLPLIPSKAISSSVRPGTSPNTQSSGWQMGHTLCNLLTSSSDSACNRVGFADVLPAVSHFGGLSVSTDIPMLLTEQTKRVDGSGFRCDHCSFTASRFDRVTRHMRRRHTRESTSSPSVSGFAPCVSSAAEKSSSDVPLVSLTVSLAPDSTVASSDCFIDSISGFSRSHTNISHQTAKLLVTEPVISSSFPVSPTPLPFIQSVSSTVTLLPKRLVLETDQPNEISVSSPRSNSPPSERNQNLEDIDPFCIPSVGGVWFREQCSFSSNEDRSFTKQAMDTFLDQKECASEDRPPDAEWPTDLDRSGSELDHEAAALLNSSFSSLDNLTVKQSSHEVMPPTSSITINVAVDVCLDQQSIPIGEQLVAASALVNGHTATSPDISNTPHLTDGIGEFCVDPLMVVQQSDVSSDKPPSANCQTKTANVPASLVTAAALDNVNPSNGLHHVTPHENVSEIPSDISSAMRLSPLVTSPANDICASSSSNQSANVDSSHSYFYANTKVLQQPSPNPPSSSACSSLATSSLSDDDDLLFMGFDHAGKTAVKRLYYCKACRRDPFVTMCTHHTNLERSGTCDQRPHTKPERSPSLARTKRLRSVSVSAPPSHFEKKVIQPVCLETTLPSSLHVLGSSAASTTLDMQAGSTLSETRMDYTGNDTVVTPGPFVLLTKEHNYSINYDTAQLSPGRSSPPVTLSERKRCRRKSPLRPLPPDPTDTLCLSPSPSTVVDLISADHAISSSADKSVFVDTMLTSDSMTQTNVKSVQVVDISTPSKKSTRLTRSISCHMTSERKASEKPSSNGLFIAPSQATSLVRRRITPKLSAPTHVANPLDSLPDPNAEMDPKTRIMVDRSTGELFVDGQPLRKLVPSVKFPKPHPFPGLSSKMISRSPRRPLKRWSIPSRKPSRRRNRSKSPKVVRRAPTKRPSTSRCQPKSTLTTDPQYPNHQLPAVSSQAPFFPVSVFIPSLIRAPYSPIHARPFFAPLVNRAPI